ncbi:MAG: hypothetical protein BroJett030_20740 [Alphaproteobacteria bacterium]|nr:MAG: hypothetical protein BroJett030_20740 [Alphaproteobacteria bacterium]
MSKGVDRDESALSLFFAPELRAWRGEMPLAVVFWGYGVAAGLGLAVLYAGALDMERLALQQGLIILSIGYTAWSLIAIWRCAANARPLWGSLARRLIVPWALNAAFVLFFLEIDLIIGYARG